MGHDMSKFIISVMSIILGIFIFSCESNTDDPDELSEIFLGDILINEFVAGNDGSYLDEINEADDWIELFNTTSEELDVGGLFITDVVGDAEPWQIPTNHSEETTIPAGGFLVLWADKDTDQGALHVNIKLSQDGESIVLYGRDAETVIDSVSFGAQIEGSSFARNEDADKKWSIFAQPTPKATNNTVQTLLLQEYVVLDMSEPSGLTWGPNHEYLFSVNDPPNNHVYKLDINGTILETFAFTGNDLEGITVNPNDSTLWVLEELLGDVIQLSLEGEELSREHIEYLGDTGENTFEGICYEPESGQFYILREKDSPVILTYDGSFNLLNEQMVGFSKDISGVHLGRNPGELIIVSDESRMLIEWSVSRGVLARYSMEMFQAEGVAYDEESGNIYIVGDGSNRLYTYKFPA